MIDLTKFLFAPNNRHLGGYIKNKIRLYLNCYRLAILPYVALLLVIIVNTIYYHRAK